MEHFSQALMELGAELWKEFLYILPYLLIGVLCEAIIRTFKWHVKIRKALTHYGMLAIPAAVLLGLFSPLCACATLPLVISLLVAGLPLAPAMALLVTAPIMSPSAFSMISGCSAPTGHWPSWSVPACSVCWPGMSPSYCAPSASAKRRSSASSCRPAIFTTPITRGIVALRMRPAAVAPGRSLHHNKLLVFMARFWEGLQKIGKFALLGLLIEVVAIMFIPNEWITGLLEGEGSLRS